MPFYGGFPYTGFKGVNLQNTAAIRFAADGAQIGTLSIKPMDTSRAWTFPDKSGTFGVTGTITVNLPALSANAYYGTNVTISGLRTEDALVCSLQNIWTTGFLNRGMGVLVGAIPGNGGADITFAEIWGSATVYKDLILAYTITR